MVLKDNYPVVQVALDVLDIEHAVEIAEKAVRGGVQWIEAGTPLIKSEGIRAVKVLAEKFPDYTIVADLKTMDVGGLEVKLAANVGADVTTVLAVADDSTIKEAVNAGKEHGILIMADLINHPNPKERAVELEKMGVDIIGIHVGIDQQNRGLTPFEMLRLVRPAVSIPISVAGGIKKETIKTAYTLGAQIIIVGSGITKAKDPEAASKALVEVLHRSL